MVSSDRKFNLLAAAAAVVLSITLFFVLLSL